MSAASLWVDFQNICFSIRCGDRSSWFFVWFTERVIWKLFSEGTFRLSPVLSGFCVSRIS